MSWSRWCGLLCVLTTGCAAPPTAAPKTSPAAAPPALAQSIGDPTKDAGTPAPASDPSGLHCGDGSACSVRTLTDAAAALLAARPDRAELTLTIEAPDDAALGTLAKVPWVTSLTIEGGAPTSLAPIAVLPLRSLGLERMRVRALAPLLAPLAKTASLEELHLFQLEMKEDRDLSALAQLPQLKTVTLDVEDVELTALAKLPRLEALWIQAARRATEWSFLGDLATVKELGLRNCAIPDTAPLRKLVKLERLAVGSGVVPSFGFVASMKGLKHADFAMTELVDVTPLLLLPLLESLDIGLCQVKDIRPLAQMKRLKRARISQGYPAAEVAPLRKKGIAVIGAGIPGAPCCSDDTTY